MTQEEKLLLLKDLCSRLPYGVKGVLCDDCTCTLDRIWTKKGYESVIIAGDYYDIEDFKPYLFPLSNMTEEQAEELGIEKDKDLLLLAQGLRKIGEGDKSLKGKLIAYNAIDWLNAHHFDYRNLIDKNLAIDCTNLNIY